MAEPALRLDPRNEARVGQKNGITQRWARRGTRPRAPHDQLTASAYIFGAICPAKGKGAALVLPRCDTAAMALHLEEISATVAPGAHAVLLLDQAGWHGSKALKLPANITLLPLPPRSPELNPVENVWRFIRDNWLSNRVFASYDGCRRSLLRSLEQAHRPALANHLAGHARLGASVRINETWYYTCVRRNCTGKSGPNPWEAGSGSLRGVLRACVGKSPCGERIDLLQQSHVAPAGAVGVTEWISRPFTTF